MVQRLIYVILEASMLVTSWRITRVKVTHLFSWKFCIPPHDLDLRQRLWHQPSEPTLNISGAFWVHICNIRVRYSKRAPSGTSYTTLITGSDYVEIWAPQKDSYLLGASACPLCSSVHTRPCAHTQTLILLLPPSIMSLSKDLLPHISLWTFLRSRLLHPWNWRLEWILSPLINFIYHSLCLLLLLTVNLLIWKGSCWTDVLRSSHYSADPWHLIRDRTRFLSAFSIFFKPLLFHHSHWYHPFIEK